MKIHPRIRKYIDLIKDERIDKIESNELNILLLLKENGATQTEAIITIHLGFDIDIGESEKIVFPSTVWERETIQDIAYQTFLYMNYNPDDLNFYYDENSVKFSLNTKIDKKNND